MKKYKYQMHTHTHPCSHCSHMMPADFVKALHDGGYQGAVLTNHFYWGNTGIERDLVWADFVKYYEQDYIDCKKCAEDYDLDIIFGIEEHIDGGLEILVYGVTPEILYNHPELREHRIEDYNKIREEYNLVIIQAHPFRDRDYIVNRGVLSHSLIDGIEVYNSGNKPENNVEAEEYAKENTDLIFISGADTHSPANVCVGGIAVDERITTGKDLVKILKSKNFEIIKN